MTAARRILLAIVAMALGSGLLAAISALNRLDSVDVPSEGPGTDIVMHFSRRPEFQQVPLLDGRVLVLDFRSTIYDRTRKSMEFSEGPFQAIELTQFSRDRVRMSIKLAEKGRLEIFRYKENRTWTLTLRFVPATPPPPKRDYGPHQGTPVVVIDPGHGGKDAGAKGRRILEKTFTLAVAREARKIFEKDGRIELRLTRDSDKYVSLGARSAYADSVGAHLFISIHANSTLKGNPRGVEVYFLSLKGASDEQARLMAEKENAADTNGHEASSILDQILDSMVQTSTINQSSELAQIVMERMIKSTRQRNRGIRQAGFKVLKPINIPSVLLECGFISNRSEESLMRSTKYQQAVARVLYQSAIDYLEMAGRL